MCSPLHGADTQVCPYFADVNHDLQGNPDLQAERSDHMDLSIQRRTSIGSAGLRMEMSGFHNDVRDMITLAQVEGNTYTYVNIGAVKTAGASVRGGVEYRDLSLTVGGTFTGYKEQTATNTVNPWRRTPEAQASLTWKRNAWSATLFGKYSGSSMQYVADEDGVSTRTLDGFLLADANVGHRFWKERMNMVLGCKNLANVTNLQATGAGGAHTGEGGSVAMSTGRTIFLRIDLVFKKQGG